MAKTAAERMRASRERNIATVKSATDVTKSERNTPSATGPLDVYSESRWKFLQSRGHKWDPDKQRSVRPDGVIGVTVPGDPGFEGVTTFDNGDVYSTTAEDRKRITKDRESKTPTFDDLPLDVQAEIDHMCSESNNGEREASHSRAAMTERALSYQAMFGKRPSRGMPVSEQVDHVKGVLTVVDECSGQVAV